MISLMSGEKTYPIYRFWTKFFDPEHNVSGSEMLRAHLDPEAAAQALQKFTDDNLDARRTGLEGDYTIRSLQLEIVDTGWRFLCEETWCCRWFNHYTFNTHLTDEELLLSFEQYVTRHKDEQVRDWESIEMHRERVDDNYVCLMGAEDRYRWKKVCRCEHCQKRGIVMIDH